MWCACTKRERNCQENVKKTFDFSWFKIIWIVRCEGLIFTTLSKPPAAELSSSLL